MDRVQGRAGARRALADPAVRAELLGLLGTDGGGRQQRGGWRRPGRELAGLEARWLLLEEDEHEP